MSGLKTKVATLLSYFQASLYSHLIAVATDRDTADSALGSLPFSFDDYVREEEAESSLNHSVSVESRRREDSKALSVANTSREEASLQIKEDLLTGSFLKSDFAFVDSQEEVTVKSTKVDLGERLERANIRKRRELVPDDLNKPQEFSDSEDYITQQVKPKLSKVLLRKQNQSAEVKPARFILDDPCPHFETISPDKPSAKTLYAEAITTTYSLGGDGFALHSGDVVMILQFLEEYGLAEVRWEGLQGLFPVNTLKVMTPIADKPKLSSRILALAQKELLTALARSDTSPSQPRTTKLLTRQRKREKSSH